MAIVKTSIVAFSNIMQLFKDRKLASDLGGYVVDASKEAINSGLSPVRGVGRFAPYVAEDFRKFMNKQKLKGKSEGAKAQRKNISNRTKLDIKKLYPYSIQKKFPAKLLRPVNLELSGDFLSKLSWKTVSPAVIKVGMYGMSEKQRKMFETHNEGTHKHVPQRKFLPTGEKDEYIVSIMREVLNIFSEWVGKQIKKSKVSKN